MSFIFHKKNEEEIILSIQDHWIILVKPVFLIISGVVLFLFMTYLAVLLKPTSAFLGLAALFFGTVFLGLCVHFFFIFLLHWEISALVFTTKRIIDLRFFPYVEDDVVHTEIVTINEIEKRKRGILQNLLNYGEVIVIVPGKSGSVEFHNVPHPGRIANFIENIKLGRTVEKKDFERLKPSFSKKFEFLNPDKKDE
ncbi:hypothetical protein IT413_05840 [Candidatus Peregrinibacteria bacterium]|nr:hypothetical protein [Candidatus Peregrinibacteria bacterium]